MPTVIVGQVHRATASFRDAAGDPVDPAAITVTYSASRDILDITTVVWPGAGIAKDDTGEFHIDITPTTPGAWYVHWDAPGVYPAVYDEQFDARNSFAPWLTGDAPVYATIEEMRRYLRVDRDGTNVPNEDVYEVLRDASRYVDERTGRRFYAGPVGEQRVYTAYDAQYIDIDEALAITEIALDLDGTGTFETAMIATDWNGSPATVPYRSIRVNYGLGRYALPMDTRQQIRITGTFGANATGSHPALVNRVTKLVAARLWELRDARLGIIENLAGGPAKTIRPDSNIEDMLSQLTLRNTWVIV